MSNKQREALQQIIELAEYIQHNTEDASIADACLKMMQKAESALAEPEQEPVRWLVDDAVWERKPTTYDVQLWKDCGMKIMPTIRPLYTSPQPREWQQLSNIEVMGICNTYGFEYWKEGGELVGIGASIISEISTALRAKNGG